MRQVKVGTEGRCATTARAWVADSFWLRLRGLLGRPALQPGEGMLIRPCSSVHTCFMGYPLDLVFLDEGCRVLRARKALPPFRFTLGPQGSHCVLELPAGGIDTLGVREGDTLRVA